jgi:hypothetical protein
MRMRRHVSAALSGGGLTPAADLTLLTVAVILMLGGSVMLLVGVGAGIAIPLIAVGIAVTAIVELDKRRHRVDR